MTLEDTTVRVVTVAMRAKPYSTDYEQTKTLSFSIELDRFSIPRIFPASCTARSALRESGRPGPVPASRPGRSPSRSASVTAPEYAGPAAPHQSSPATPRTPGACLSSSSPSPGRDLLLPGAITGIRGGYARIARSGSRCHCAGTT